jgi:predicted Zn-dependent protease
VSKRLAYLEKVTREGSREPMAWYGLALEYKTLERWDEALQTFTTLRTNHPEYVAGFHMCGQMLAGLGRKDEARAWLEAGIDAARKAGNSHAMGEMEGVLATLGDD